MAVTTVTGLTADRMIEMEAATIIDGDVQGNNLHLQTRGGTDIDAGNVRGPQGAQGTPGTNGTNGHDGSGAFRCTSTTRPTGLTAVDEGYLIYETDTDLYRTWTGTRWKCQERVICTSTTKPTLVAADKGVYAYLTDVNYGQTWSGTAWVTDNRIICNSTTRPTLGATDKGVKIYELDTGYEYVWTGAAWTMPQALGILAPAQVRIVNRTASTTPVSIFAGGTTLTLLANRSVKVHFVCGFIAVTGAAPNYIKIGLYVDGAPYGSDMLNNDFETVGTRQSVYASLLLTPALAAGTHTLELFFSSSGGTAQITATAAPSADPGQIVFWIEDIGPAM